jgi:hypothetical protein
LRRRSQERDQRGVFAREFTASQGWFVAKGLRPLAGRKHDLIGNL